ncbi:hypothetical protein [Roseobacter sp. MH60115]|uniref:hypothetical protein n=1 Tax=Roseobacter sp. MH60115 TaxID=2785324 RepID=UPI0018A2DD89|nr:hypothetical protein [Roseobacter sp. MH60115]
MQSEKTALKNQLDSLNRQIESLLDRIVEANNVSVVSAYEDKIEKLERDKILPKEKMENSVPEKGRFEDCMELALRLPLSPWKIYKMVTTLCVKPCFGWCLLSHFDTVQMVYMEIPNYHSLSGA